jgi:hypothetical protein
MHRSIGEHQTCVLEGERIHVTDACSERSFNQSIVAVWSAKTLLFHRHFEAQA